MPKTLAEALEECGLPDRTQMILLLAPGCLFGCPPDNLGQIMKMVDCTTCRAIMGIVKQCSDIAAGLQKRIDTLRGPVRARNAVRQSKYGRHRRWPLIGRFARLPVLELEPDHADKPWFVQGRQELEELTDLLPQLSGHDTRHWGDEDRRQASREVVGRFVAKDCTFVRTLPGLRIIL